jgi:hypothetical protein
MTEEKIPLILDDEYLLDLVRSFVYSSQDSFEEMMQRISLHSHEMPEMANVALFSLIANFYDEFCHQITNGETDLMVVIFHSLTAVMEDKQLQEFQQKIALNPFAIMAGMNPNLEE